MNYNNCSSSSKDVISGFPQGTVIGPNAFIGFVNDLPDIVSSNLYMFAYDTKMYIAIKGITDYKQLQTDINNMVTWSMNWHLKFNPTKCKVMSLGHSQRNYFFTPSFFFF